MWFLGDDEELSEERNLPYGLPFNRQILPRALRSYSRLVLDASAGYWSELSFLQPEYNKADALSTPIALCGIAVVSHLPAIPLIELDACKRRIALLRSTREEATLSSKDVAQLLSLAPGTIGLCHWADGEIQIVAPNISHEMVSKIHLPEIPGFSISFTRWCPEQHQISDPLGATAEDSELDDHLENNAESREAIKSQEKAPCLIPARHSLLDRVGDFSSSLEQPTPMSKLRTAAQVLPTISSTRGVFGPQSNEISMAHHYKPYETKRWSEIPVEHENGYHFTYVPNDSDAEDEVVPNGIIPQPLEAADSTITTTQLLGRDTDSAWSAPGTATSSPVAPPPAPLVSADIGPANVKSLKVASKILIGSECSTLGLKVKKGESTFLTVSTHAAFDAVNAANPIGIKGAKASTRGKIRKLFHRSRKHTSTWNEIESVEVRDSINKEPVSLS